MNARAPLAGTVALAMVAAGCLASAGSPRGAAAPPRGSDAEVVFQQIAAVRSDDGATPPSWIDALAPMAQQGAVRVANGEPGHVVVNEIADRASGKVGPNVEVWWMQSDTLYGVQLATKLVNRDTLTIAIGVAQMLRGSAGRYAIVMIVPQGGMTPQL